MSPAGIPAGDIYKPVTSTRFPRRQGGTGICRTVKKKVIYRLHMKTFDKSKVREHNENTGYLRGTPHGKQ